MTENPITELAIFAITMHETFTEFLNVGFTREEALELTKECFRNAKNA